VSVWEETQLVAVANGQFSVILGSVVPIDVATAQVGRFLSIKIGSDPELLPWTTLTSAPFAIVAEHAATAEALAMAATNRYYTVCAEAFTPNSSVFSFTRNTIRVYSTTAGFASLAAPLHLPHGARLIELYVLFDDLDATRDVSLVLRRTNVTTGAFEQLTAVTSGVANAAGLTIGATNLFSDDIVDNANWAYSLQAGWASPNGSNLSLLTVRVTYQIDSPLP
jgi:hypothetical protein